MCFGLCQMANRFQDSPSGPGLARSTCQAGWADPLEHTTRSQAAQRPRDSGSPKSPSFAPKAGSRSLDRKFLFVGIKQREKPPEGAEGRNGAIFPSSFQSMKCRDYSTLDRVGSSRSP